MDAIFGRLVCCGPGGAEGYVHQSDDDSSDSDFLPVTVAHRRDGSGDDRTDLAPPDHLDPGSLRVIPSTSRPAERRRHHKSSSIANFVQQGPSKERLEEEKEGSGAAGGASSLSTRWAAFSLRDLFSPKQQHQQQQDQRRGGDTRKFFPGGDGNKRGGKGGKGRGKGDGDFGDGGDTALNLAFQETRRLPDVAGEERVAWAAGVVRIDLTETGIRTLRGLDAFPNVQTLVLDSNGLLSLPMDCPWCPAMETLWLCNNEVENLDGLLCQINDVFPRLKSLALMGNPVWPAAKARAAAAAAAAAAEGGGGGGAAAAAGGAVAGMGDVIPGGADEGKEEAAYRLHVVRRLPGLVTLDCADVTEEERSRAKERADTRPLMDVSDLLLEVEPTTDVEESLPRDTPPGSTRSVSHGVGKLLEDDRDRRANLPDRRSLPSTWYKEAVVMDVGSGWTRMGLAGQEKPSCVFPSIVGRVDLRAYDRISGQDERVYVGHQAVDEANKRVAERELPDGNGPMPSPILLQHPLSNGVVTDWDDMEELWRFGIEDELGLDAIEHPVLMADSTTTDSSQREKATEVLLETLSTPAVHMALQPVLALYACGPTSGLVVDIGESGTQVAPIFDGFVLENGIRWVGLGGKDVTRNLGALVNARVALMGGQDFEPDDPCDVLKLEEMKAKVCYVADDVDKENAKMELSLSKPYVLPDGTRITLGRERYRAAEPLFDPAMNLREEESLQNVILDSILSCDRKTWPILAQTVILTGGTTELVGLNRRLQRELTKASRANGVRLKYTVMVPEDDHNNTVWIGGSMLASTGALDGLWFTRAEYEEYGAGYIHSKFAA